MDTRIIFHVDMDAFFASVEVLKDPSLKGKPVIVGGRPDQRGVVSTCSYEARGFGVHSAMSLSEAKRRCPHAVFLDGDFAAYKKYSDHIMEIFESFTPIVEKISIDEAYLDVTETAKKYLSGRALGQYLKQTIVEQTGLPCSIGIATNKLVAKIASSAAKPNGLVEVLPGQESTFLAPLSIQSLPGIGEKTREGFNREGILFIGDLQEMGLETLMHRYGDRWGYHLFQIAHGKDDRPVESAEQSPQSIGAETTFETDQAERALLLQALSELVEKAWRRLRRHKMRTRAICLKLRDAQFSTSTYNRLLLTDTQDLLTLQLEFRLLLGEVYEEGTPLRLIGVSLRKLTDLYWQPSLWSWEEGSKSNNSDRNNLPNGERGI